MSKAKAAASIVGGLMLALVDAVGMAALIGATLVDAYSASVALWVGLPLLFVAGSVLTVYGVAVVLREFSNVASDSLGGLSDLESMDDVKELSRLLERSSRDGPRKPRPTLAA